MEEIKINSKGPIVELIQSKLKKLGYYNGEINGAYNYETLLAVKYFQSMFGIVPSGIIDKNTWDRLGPYINGCTYYDIKSGDTIYNLAKKFNTNVELITYANMGVNIYNLQIGERIIIPFENVVVTDIKYSYDIMKLNLNALVRLYPFLQSGIIGKSELGRDIPYIKIGIGKKEICYNAAIHANEWITSPVLMKFIEDFSKAYVLEKEIYGYNARQIFNEVSLYIVPMLNPDGVDLVTGAIKDNNILNHTKMIADNYKEIPYPDGWKANINGIDLNLQFPANWEKAREIKFEQGYITPAPRDFVGYIPLMASEAKSIYNFTLQHNFKLILTYHSQGEVIYWKYLDYNPKDSEAIGKKFSEVSGYELEITPSESGNAGYKDWFIQEYNRPGYTIEVGKGKNPLPISDFDKIYNDNIGILTLATRVI